MKIKMTLFIILLIVSACKTKPTHIETINSDYKITVKQNLNKNIILNGYVKDKKTFNPIEFATITLKDNINNYFTFSDSLGYFEIEIPAEKYNIEIDYLQDQKITIKDLELIEYNNYFFSINLGSTIIY